jgi:threonine synthase
MPLYFYSLSLFSLFKRQAANDILVSRQVSQEQVKEAIQTYHKQYNYLLDPHSAVGAHAIKTLYAEKPEAQFILLCTASPEKFKETVEEVIGQSLNLELYKKLEQMPKVSLPMNVGDDWEETLRKKVEEISNKTQSCQ